ncbi:MULTISPECIES: response regulator transcription factor [Enterococcus]|uniref:Two-component system response regulator receiver protein n=2 Tax=Enterococcus TaxID=1350 RepID=S1NIM5_9ENTE|nr:response regulator transcription factor [Enterococcus dispar]EOT43750.1 two-component system response regulator receiver protein [Enterococcus dispar ATCC 51266]EOW85578.1 two-component system response regulator receiver protein [Enterococcus dispar ATCC 51266]MCU7358162.1 response regulator transcription factor [Enterococcus dispar]MDT2705679.1 response regulator transcription factor [Enterococcus dispar]OJG37757.1 two-component system response regulator receiver protein [Enterococcus disp
MKKVLIVDDEPSIVTLLAFNLEKEGYVVTAATDGNTGLELALTKDFDFIILDIMLPGIDGIEITKRLRQEKKETPILLLTAKDDTIDRILGLEIGADDYLTKPFSPREVLARMKAIFRRMRPAEKQKNSEIENTDDELTGETLQIGTIKADLDNYEVTVNDEKIFLTPKEFELLVYFMKRKDRVIDRDTLLDRIWNFDFAGQSRIVDVHVSHLREKIEEDPKNPRYLLTVRGFGYKFQEPKL